MVQQESHLRAAVQAARQMLVAVTGGTCSDIAVCCYHHNSADAADSTPDQLQVLRFLLPMTRLQSRSHVMTLCMWNSTDDESRADFPLASS